MSRCIISMMFWVPTANLPDSSLVPYNTTLGTGVHYGYARVLLSSDSKDAPLVLSGKEASPKYDSGSNEDDQVWPMVMSIGWNPFYNNTTRTAVSCRFFNSGSLVEVKPCDVDSM